MTIVHDTVLDALDGERLDRVVAMIGDIARSAAATLVEDGSVTIEGTVVTRRSERVSTGSQITVDLPDIGDEPTFEPDPSVPVEVVYEDDSLLVVDKPAGLVVHPGAGNQSGTLAHGLLARYPELAGVGESFRPGVVHRLDKDTSGLLVVARSESVRQALSDALADRLITRRYRAMVWGHVEEAQGMVDAPIGRSSRDPTRMAVVVGGRPARTRYEVLGRFMLPVESTEIVCLLDTGRTHQIRVHLQGIGHPVLGDPRYGGRRKAVALDRQFLHAEHLGFTHPVTGEALAFDSSLPDELRRVRATFS